MVHVIVLMVSQEQIANLQIQIGCKNFWTVEFIALFSFLERGFHLIDSMEKYTREG